MGCCRTSRNSKNPTDSDHLLNHLEEKFGVRTQVRGWIIVAFLVPALTVPLGALLLQGEAELVASMPDGEGKKLVTTLCVGCHLLQIPLTQQKSQEQWRDTIDDMISRGAQIFDDETELMVGYLSSHYGIESEPAQTSGSSQQETNLSQNAASDLSGEDLLSAECSQCHADTIWRDLRLDRTEWEELLNRMVEQGAPWEAVEIVSMADLLSRSRGPSGTE